MSEIVRHSEADRALSHIVRTDSGHYFYVDSNDTIDCGYETMVFWYDEKHKEVSDWGELYVRRYDTFYDMRKGHYYICHLLEKILDYKDVYGEKHD